MALITLIALVSFFGCECPGDHDRNGQITTHDVNRCFGPSMAAVAPVPRVYVCVKRVDSIPSRDMLGKSDPFLKVSYEGETYQTSVVEDTSVLDYGPTGECFAFPVTESSANIAVEIHDKDVLSDDKIATCSYTYAGYEEVDALVSCGEASVTLSVYDGDSIPGMHVLDSLCAVEHELLRSDEPESELYLKAYVDDRYVGRTPTRRGNHVVWPDACIPIGPVPRDAVLTLQSWDDDPLKDDHEASFSFTMDGEFVPRQEYRVAHTGGSVTFYATTLGYTPTDTYPPVDIKVCILRGQISGMWELFTDPDPTYMLRRGEEDVLSVRGSNTVRPEFEDACTTLYASPNEVFTLDIRERDLQGTYVVCELRIREYDDALDGSERTFSCNDASVTMSFTVANETRHAIECCGETTRESLAARVGDTCVRAVTTTTTTTAAVPTTALVEMASADWCSPCASVSSLLEDLKLQGAHAVVTHWDGNGARDNIDRRDDVIGAAAGVPVVSIHNAHVDRAADDGANACTIVGYGTSASSKLSATHEGCAAADVDPSEWQLRAHMCVGDAERCVYGGNDARLDVEVQYVGTRSSSTAYVYAAVTAFRWPSRYYDGRKSPMAVLAKWLLDDEEDFTEVRLARNEDTPPISAWRNTWPVVALASGRRRDIDRRFFKALDRGPGVGYMNAARRTTESACCTDGCVGPMQVGYSWHSDHGCVQYLGELEGVDQLVVPAPRRSDFFYSPDGRGDGTSWTRGALNDTVDGTDDTTDTTNTSDVRCDRAQIICPPQNTTATNDTENNNTDISAWLVSITIVIVCLIAFCLLVGVGIFCAFRLSSNASLEE